MGLNASLMWNSAGMPVGTRKVFWYRNNPANVPNAPAYPGNAFVPGSALTNFALLGLYNLEMFSWRTATSEIQRRDPVGGDLDFALLRQPITGSATVQLSTSATPNIMAGTDAFYVSPGFEGDGLTPLPLMLFVCTDAGNDENEGQARKQSVTLRFDRFNSDPFWQS
jgi:hypothetical protein